MYAPAFHREREVVVNLHSMLLAGEAQGVPVTVGVIGAGKFGTMFLAQARSTRGPVGVADLDIGRARAQLRAAGWDDATGLAPQNRGLAFPPATRFDLADVC